MSRQTSPGINFGIACSRALHNALLEVANDQGVTVAAVCREILSSHFGLQVVHPPHGGARRGAGRKRHNSPHAAGYSA